jgi:RNA polymerase sigma-70 factor (ECF subfamily)
VSGYAAGRTAKDLEVGFHGQGFSTAYLTEATNRRLGVIRPIGGSTAVERDEAPGQAVSAPGPNPRADFEAFWGHHYRHYLKVLMTIGATREDAHDTIHDVIVDMLEKNTLDGLRNPKAWVRKAVLHTYYDQQKRRRRSREIERHQAPGSYVDDGPNVWEDWQWVEQILSTLPPTQRAVIELIIAELDAREIADLLGKTPGSIRQNLAHARKRLRANLGKDYQIDSTTCPAPASRKEETP